MRVRSGVFGLLHPQFKAARIALAAGAVAGLAMLGACADGPVASKIAGPSAPSSPSYGPGVVGDFTHIVNVCVHPDSDLPPVGGYTFTTAKAPVDVDGYPDGPPGSANPSPSPNLEPGDIIDASVTLGVNDCAPVFIRASPWSSGTPYETGDRVIHDGKTWQALVNNTGVTPAEGANWTQIAATGNVSVGGQNPRAKMLITATVPAGYTVSLDPANCINEGFPYWQECETKDDQAISSANIFHGSQVVFLFETPNIITGGSATIGDVAFNDASPTTFAGTFRIANTTGGAPIHINSVTLTLFKTGGGSATPIALSGCTIIPSSFDIAQSGSQTVSATCTLQSGAFADGEHYRVHISVDVNGGQNSPYTNTGSFKI